MEIVGGLDKESMRTKIVGGNEVVVGEKIQTYIKMKILEFANCYAKKDEVNLHDFMKKYMPYIYEKRRITNKEWMNAILIICKQPPQQWDELKTIVYKIPPINNNNCQKLLLIEKLFVPILNGIYI